MTKPLTDEELAALSGRDVRKLKNLPRRFPKMRGFGIAWFTAESWPRLLEIAADRSVLPDTFEEFERVAGARFNALAAAGHPLEKIVLDVAAVDRLADWCRELGRPVDADARSVFATVALTERDRRGGQA
jgi:hypothetical protein